MAARGPPPLASGPMYQDRPPAAVLGHDLPLGRPRSRRREGGPARALRHGPAARRRRAHPADRGGLRPRVGNHHDGRPGRREDHEGDAPGLRRGRHVPRLRRAARPPLPRREGGPRRPRGRRPRRRARLPAAARLQGGRQPDHGDHRLPLEGPRLLGGEVQGVLRRAHRLHGRRLVRPPGLRDGRAQGRPREGEGRRGRRDRAAPDDARLLRTRAGRSASRRW